MFRDSGKIFQQFSQEFPRVFLENPEQTPETATAISSFLSFDQVFSGSVLRESVRCEATSAISHYCALWGLWCLTMTNRCGTLSPFSEPVPLESMRSGGVIPPQKGYLIGTWAMPHEKQGKMGAIPPLRYCLGKLLREMGGYLALGR